jgi:hypothetical protein
MPGNRVSGRLLFEGVVLMGLDPRIMSRLSNASELIDAAKDATQLDVYFQDCVHRAIALLTEVQKITKPQGTNSVGKM